MSLQFSRSLRSLKLDSYRATRVAMILAIINMVILLGWFVFGNVTLYEVSEDITLGDDGVLVGMFPQDAVTRLVPGQAAVLRIDAGQDQPLVTAPALLIHVDDASGMAQFLVLTTDIPESVLRAGLSGRGEIEVLEVEYVTPVTLVFRATGKYLGARHRPGGSAWRH